MPLSPEEAESLQQMENDIQGRIDDDNETDYDVHAADLNEIGSLLDEHYKSQRQVDDDGHLTEDATARHPSSVEGTDPDNYSYFYEPNLGEVKSFYRKNPAVLDRLGLRKWATDVARKGTRTPNVDMYTGQVMGWNVTPDQTHLDELTEAQGPYARGVEEMYKQRVEDAQRKGESVKRYRDIKFQKGQTSDYIKGGIIKLLNRGLAAPVVAAANSMTGGIAGPAADTITDAIDYGLGTQGINLEDYAGPQPKTEEIIERNPFGAVLGTVGGYVLPGNPTNFIQGGLAELAGHASAGAGRRLLGSAIAGGATSALEGVTSDIANASNQPMGAGDYIGKDLGNVLATAGGNMLPNFAVGAGISGISDAAAQGITNLRHEYRNNPNNAPLKTLEQAGGGAHVAKGAVASPEIQEYVNASEKDDANFTPGAMAAAKLAPDIDRSLVNQSDELQSRIGGQMEEYFNHPAYNQQEVSAKPAVDGLVDLAKRGWTRGQVDNAPMNADRKRVDQLGGILRDYSQVNSVPYADAPSVAHNTGGTVIDGELANQLYGFTPDDSRFIKPGRLAVIRPNKLTAEALTILENRIDDELDMAKARKGGKGNDDPVWNKFNEQVKAMRDDFPLYRDAEGNLVAPPPDSVRNEPFGEDPEAAPPRDDERMTTLPRPIPIEGGGGAAPEALPGAGPGQPDLPSNPFDARARIQQPQGGVDALPRPIGVGGDDMVARPEGLYGVGPGGPPIPENPFDQRLPVSRERVAPLLGVDVQGGERSPPQQLDPNARMGIGPRHNPEPVQSFTNEGLPLPGKQVSQQPTRDVQGTYNKPPAVEAEPAPATNRNPYGFASRGEPAHETPLPPSERAPAAPDDATPLSLLAGNKLAMPVEEPPASGARGPDSEVRIGEAATMKVAKKLKEIAGQSPKAIANKPDIVALLKERDALPMVYDDAKGTEAMMSGLKKRGASQLEIETAMLQYQIERGKAAAARGEPARPNHQRTFQESPEADAPRERTERAGPPPKVSGLSPEQTIRLVNGRYSADEFATRAKDLQDHGFRVTPNNLHARDQLGGADRMGSPDANGNAGNKALSRIADDSNKPLLDKEVSGYERGAGPEKRGGLEMMLDAQLDRPDAPRVPNTEIEEIGALQTADREQVAADQKTYVDDIFSPGAEARANEVEKVKHLLEHQEVIDEAMRIVNDVDRRLGGEAGIPQEQKQAMLVSLIEKRLGRKIDVEDLIRAGLISAGLVQMATDEDDSGDGVDILTAGVFGFGRGKKGAPHQATEPPKGPSKPTQPEATLANGRKVRGFSALRNEQHSELSQLEKAKTRVGVSNEQTLEDRIRTYGQRPNMYTPDKELLKEAVKIGKENELRTAAGAAVYPGLRARGRFGGTNGPLNRMIDFLGLRGYSAGEKLAGRFSKDNVRNPYAREPNTRLGRIQKAALEDPASRLLDLSAGTQGARYGNDAKKAIWKALFGDEKYEENKKEEEQDASP